MAMELLDGITLKHRVGGKPHRNDVMLPLGIKNADALDVLMPRKLFTATSNLPTFLSPSVDTRRFSTSVWRGASSRELALPVDGSRGMVGRQCGTSDESRHSLGTVAYMSPEQVHGKELDVRTDLVPFGVVLYEWQQDLAFSRRRFWGHTRCLLERQPVPTVRLKPDLPPKLKTLSIGRWRKTKNYVISMRRKCVPTHASEAGFGFGSRIVFREQGGSRL